MVALTGIRPPSSAYGNNKAVEGVILKCPLWVATMHHVFRISKVQLIFIRHEDKKYSVYTLEISNNNNAF